MVFLLFLCGFFFSKHFDKICEFFLYIHFPNRMRDAKITATNCQMCDIIYLYLSIYSNVYRYNKIYNKYGNGLEKSRHAASKIEFGKCQGAARAQTAMENAEAVKRLESFSFVRKNYGKTNHFSCMFSSIYYFFFFCLNLFFFFWYAARACRYIRSYRYRYNNIIAINTDTDTCTCVFILSIFILVRISICILCVCQHIELETFVILVAKFQFRFGKCLNFVVFALLVIYLQEKRKKRISIS